MSDDPVHAWREANMPDKILRVLGVLTADEFVRFADGVLNIMILADREFARRFPNEYAVWAKARDVD